MYEFSRPKARLYNVYRGKYLVGQYRVTEVVGSRPPRLGGVILNGRWTCPDCEGLYIHNEDCACRTPGCECNQCDYRGSNFDGE